MISYTAIFALVAIAIFAAIWLWASMTVTTSWSITETGEGTGVGGSNAQSYTGNDIISATITVAHSTTNQENDLTFNTGSNKLQSIVIISDKDLSMYTNHASGSSPDDTIALKAGIAFEWHRNSGITCPIAGSTGAVSKLFFTNAGSTSADDATVKIRGIQNV